VTAPAAGQDDGEQRPDRDEFADIQHAEIVGLRYRDAADAVQLVAEGNVMEQQRQREAGAP
jgi:hypothetical protein